MSEIEYDEINEKKSLVKVKCKDYIPREGNDKFIICKNSMGTSWHCPIRDRKRFGNDDRLDCDSLGNILVPSLYYPIFVRKYEKTGANL